MAKKEKPSNLKSWSAGQSGNPAGRPKGTLNRSTIVRRWLEANATDGSEGIVADQLVLALIKSAMDGNVSAYRELMDSAYGKITEKSESVTYTQMGKIMVKYQDGTEKPLTFDVGKPRV